MATLIRGSPARLTLCPVTGKLDKRLAKWAAAEQEYAEALAAALKQGRRGSLDLPTAMALVELRTRADAKMDRYLTKALT